MDPLDAFWHLANFLALPGLLAGLASALAKLAWRRELAQARWTTLALWSGGAASLVAVAGLAAFGRDGRMATYGAMVLAAAVTLWWKGFGPRAGRPGRR